jgi:hypothetical protein
MAHPSAYQLRQQAEQSILQRIYDQYFDHLAYKLHDETISRIWDDMTDAMGRGSLSGIRAAIREARFWSDLLTT